MLMHVARSLTTRAGSGFDPATTQWINAVFAVDSTVVTTPQATLVDNLIVGLKADGLFSKLDRLWLFAVENQTEALVDIVADSLATAVNTPTFTTDRGYTGNGSNTSIDSNFNISSAPGRLYTQDSATLFAWANDNTSGNTSIAGRSNNANTIYPNFAGAMYGAANSSSNVSVANTNEQGLFAVTRYDATNISLFRNGADLLDALINSAAPINNTLLFLSNADDVTLRQLSVGGFGMKLTSGDHANLYARLRTYNTAVGVP